MTKPYWTDGYYCPDCNEPMTTWKSFSELNTVCLDCGAKTESCTILVHDYPMWKFWKWGATRILKWRRSK